MSASGNRPTELLSRALRSLLSFEPWRAMMTRNLPLKGLSLLLAFGLWLFVNFGERDTEETLKVPLQLRNIPAYLMVAAPRADFIDVRVLGPSTLLGRIDRNGLSIDLDLTGVRAGEAEFRIRPTAINLPRGVQVVRINPSEVSLYLEKVARKPVPVTLTLSGSLPEGLEVSAATVVPEMVELVGPASDVEGEEEARTEPVDLAALGAGELERTLALEPIGDFLTFVPVQVTGRVTVEPITITRAIDEVPVSIARAPRRFVAAPYRVRVVVRGPRGEVRDLTAEDVTVSVAVDAATPSPVEVQPAVDLPAGVELVRVEPPVVRVRPLHTVLRPEG